MAEDRGDVHPVVAVSAEARSVVLEVLASESEAPTLALWFEVTGEKDDAYTYDMYLQALSDAGVDDAVQQSDDLPVVVPAASVTRLEGAVLDVATDSTGEGGLVIINPNKPPSVPSHAGAGFDLSDPMAERVASMLEQQVNPSIAVHGGRADLVAMDGGLVHLRLSGGCQGCGMAKATLSQGIEVILREAIPEVTGIVDVTDHADGTNPYYQPARD